MTDLGDPTWPIEAARAADDMKATAPLVLAVGDVLAVTDYFVIASASNTRLVRAIVGEIEDRLKEAGGPSPVRAEGLDDLEWVLVDYGPFVVHVFTDKTREYYDLERLWRDVPSIGWQTADQPKT